MEKSQSAKVSRVKQLARERLDRHKISKIYPEVKCPTRPPFKEIKTPSLHVPKRKSHKDREIPEIGPNPFYLPPHEKYFPQPEKEKNIQRKPIEFDMDEPRNIVDHVNEEFFTVVSGKPIRPNADSKLYIRNMRNILLFKANTAYLKDKIIAIDNLMSCDELGMFNECLKMYHDTVLNFQDFIKYNFIRTKQIQKQTEKNVQEIERVQDQLEDLSFTHTTLKNQIIFLSDKLDLRERYRRFLNKVSPIWWRLTHNVGFTGRSICFKRLFVEDSDSELFASGVVILREMKCNLFFEEPEQLGEVLDSLSSQCLDYLRLHGVQEKSGIKKIVKNRDRLKAQLNADMQDLQYIIDVYESQIKYFEEQAKNYKEKFFKILNNQFKELLVSSDVLKLFLCVEHVNQSVLANVTDSRDSCAGLMGQVEVEYDQILLQLDKLDHNVVKATTEYYMRRDRMIMKKALDAQRALREWAIFEKSLRASFEPPRYKHKKR